MDHPLYLWLTTHTITTSGLLPPMAVFSQPYHTGHSDLQDYPITSSVVDLKVSFDRNAVDADGASLSVTSSAGASSRAAAGKGLKGRGVLVLTYGRLRAEDDRTMVFALGNEVGEPFRGHAVVLNVTRGAHWKDDGGGSDGWGRPVPKYGSERMKHRNATHHHRYHRMSVYWRDGVPERAPESKAGAGTGTSTGPGTGLDDDAAVDVPYVMAPLDYRDDLRLTLCAENRRRIAALPHTSGARRTMGRLRGLRWLPCVLAMARARWYG
ncbi:hypothetical protein KEM52_000462 [Ascosphaera acerosa]|nr:hypothetical protein KEM52_000462 [Ascosphaera acerosa]